MEERNQEGGGRGTTRLILIIGGSIAGAVLLLVVAMLAFGGSGGNQTVAIADPGVVVGSGAVPGTQAGSAPSGTGQGDLAGNGAGGDGSTAAGTATAGAHGAAVQDGGTPAATITGAAAAGDGAAGQGAAGHGAPQTTGSASSVGTSPPSKDSAATASHSSSEYSIPVGSSPLDTRAAHPVDLYMPNPDPAFDITTIPQLPPTDSESHFVAWMLAHTDQQEKYLRERWQRASIALERGHITRRRVLEAFLMTPREWFVRSYNLKSVYANTALPIGYGQTISGPDLVARMTDYLDPQPNDKVLEIGTGSGYQSAFLSSLSNYVYTIEIVKPLAEETNRIYLDHTAEMPQFGNIHRRMADGYYGWEDAAPFDKIIVTTGTDHIPPDLLKQLKPDGVMIIPVGPPTGQTILKITKSVNSDGSISLAREDIYHGTAKDIFVPFTAAGGGTHSNGN